MQQKPRVLRGVRAGVYVNPDRNMTSLDVELPLNAWSSMGSPSLVHCNATHNVGTDLLVFTLTPSALRGENVFAVGNKKNGKQKRVQVRLPESFSAALKRKIPITKTEKASLLPIASGGANITATLNTRASAPDPTIGKPLAKVFAQLEESKQSDLPMNDNKPTETERLDMDRNAQLRRIAAAAESIAASLKLINDKMKG